MAHKLYVVGLGPGNADLITPAAAKVLAEASCIVGYSLYLELVPEEYKINKRIIPGSMRQELERCEAAIASTLSGQSTAIVCSGDPGIYAMASLVIELLERKKLFEHIELEIVAGVPAFCAAAACLGAPVGHDFVCISLSDLLTPLELIWKRLEAAVQADLVCILYNPRSRTRQSYLEEALIIARKYRGGSCPVGLVRNATRAGEETLISTLGSFDCSLADMLSLVIIGNSETRKAGPFLLTPRGYSRKWNA